MFSLKRVSLVITLTALFASVGFAHMPSPYSASLQMGRTGDISTGPGIARSSTRADYSNKGAWSPTEVYKGDYTIPAGDTVSHGTFNGKKLWWWAKFYASGADLEPGYFAPQGGTSPWVLINSLSAEQTGSSNYQWTGWNGDMANMTGLDAKIPTWRDGAEGAYSFTHDDIGAMPFELGIKPAWDVAKEFPEIKQCWGIYVEKMSAEEWDLATQMVLDGHEMFNHSMEHTSAADQWQWFRPGQVVPTHDPAIPEEIRGLTVVGTWGDPGREPVYPYNGDGTRVFESPLVAIRATHYWTQNAPSSEAPGKDLGAPYGVVIEPEIYAKDGVEEITLATGQKQYVKYTFRDTSGLGLNEGFIAATGATWMELEDLDKYGGQGYWEPSTPALLTEPAAWDASKVWYGAGAGTIYSYEGSYWLCKDDAPGTNPIDTNPKWENLGNITIPYFSTEGSYPGRVWSSSTKYVPEDKGAPAFVAKVWCVKKWEPEEYKLNIQDANDQINQNIYERVVTAGEHFRKGKRCEYYGYPFDAYSEVTHDSLEQNGFVGARGGAKSGRPIPGDFFHPYRIDFDAFYITETDWDVDKQDEKYIYPNNPHVLLGANQMVDLIIESKGYMIREFHSVPDIADGAWYSDKPSEQWPINSAAEGVGGWWGGITAAQLKRHYEYLQTQIDADKITVYTVGEVTKYRLSANASSNPTISKSGDNYLLKVTTEDITDKYKDEISVIVSLDAAVDSLNVKYTTVDPAWGESPRRRPRKMDDSGTKWSVSINPFLGEAELIPNAAWTGQGEEVKDLVVSNTLTDNMVAVNKFMGIQNGQLAFRLPAGNYSLDLFNTMGRKVRTVDFDAVEGISKVDLNLDALGKGMFVMNVRTDGNRVMPAQRLILK